ncbi:hypothetical protein [Nonomuraea basaltis]|uniref:hypothetical protein n=1 Tax=Nonomuraea basaltis TaxID=2495887 RepID=UPI00197F2932|nr:hypothetical protein [Nonomuraea basaltis]
MRELLIDSGPATRRAEFNAMMVNFYRTKDATAAFAFLASCHPDFEESPGIL